MQNYSPTSPATERATHLSLKHTTALKYSVKSLHHNAFSCIMSHELFVHARFLTLKFLLCMLAFILHAVPVYALFKYVYKILFQLCYAASH